MIFLAVADRVDKAPEKWERVQFQRIFTLVERRAGVSGSERLSLASAGHLYRREGIADRQQASSQTEERSLLVEPGDLVINPMWLTGGSVAVSSLSGAVSPDYRVFTPNECVHPRYAHHLLRSQPYIDQYKLLVRANTTFDRRIQQGDLDAMPIALPSLQEQLQIAIFLDHQVARVDRIIAGRRRQAELLIEAADAHLATQLSPGASIGALQSAAHQRGVPEGWGSVRLSYLVTMRSGMAITADAIEPTGKYPVYGANGLRGFTSLAAHTGDFVLIGRQGALCGNVTVAAGEFWASEHAIVCTPTVDLDILWLAEVLRSMRLGQYSQSAAQPGISADVVGSLHVPLPPLNEQRRLGCVADEVRKDLASRLSELTRSVGLLTEYKSSLVTEAVSGELSTVTIRREAPG